MSSVEDIQRKVDIKFTADIRTNLSWHLLFPEHGQLQDPVVVAKYTSPVGEKKVCMSKFCPNPRDCPHLPKSRRKPKLQPNVPLMDVKLHKRMEKGDTEMGLAGRSTKKVPVIWTTEIKKRIGTIFDSWEEQSKTQDKVCFNMNSAGGSY